MLNKTLDKVEMKKFLRAKSLFDSNLITKTDACNMLGVNIYYFNKIYAQLEKGELEDEKTK